MFLEMNGSNEKGGRRISETRELTTAVNADAILGKVFMYRPWIDAIGGDLHQTNSNLENVFSKSKIDES